MKSNRLIALNLLVILLASFANSYGTSIVDNLSKTEQAHEKIADDLRFEPTHDDNTDEYRGSSNISLSNENFYVLDSQFITINPQVDCQINSIQFECFLNKTLCRKPPLDFHLIFRSIIV